MRLIDADAEVKKIEEEIKRIEQRIQNWEDNREDRSANFDVDAKIEQLKNNILHAKCEIEILNDYTTAFDVDKVISKIEDKMFSAELYGDEWKGQTVENLLCFGDVYEIIKDGG